MNGGSFGYLIKQGLSSIWRNKVMAAASIVILALSLTIIGGALLLGINVRDIFTNIESQNEVVAYIDDQADQQQIDALGEALRGMEHVQAVRFVSREEAFEIMRAQMTDAAHLFDGLKDTDTFPNAYYFTMDDLSYLGETLDAVENLASVDSTSAPVRLAEILSTVKNVLMVVVIAIIGMLMLVSIVIINNTIRITVFSRRREINIMKYVGATNRFIRLPFIVEGLAIGLLASVLASSALVGIYQVFGNMLEGAKIAWLSNTALPLGEIWYWMVGGFAIAGMLIGAVGSAVAIRKHLKV